MQKDLEAEITSVSPTSDQMTKHWCSKQQLCKSTNGGNLTHCTDIPSDCFSVRKLRWNILKAWYQIGQISFKAL